MNRMLGFLMLALVACLVFAMAGCQATASAGDIKLTDEHAISKDTKSNNHWTYELSPTRAATTQEGNK